MQLAQEKEAAAKREREEALKRAESQMTDMERPNWICRDSCASGRRRLLFSFLPFWNG